MRINSGRSILIVEDNPDDVLLIKRAFKKAEIINPLIFKYDGDEAISFLNEILNKGDISELPEFVILDLKLPKISGFEVLKFIKSHVHLKKIPVIVLTSSNQKEDVKKSYEMGANSYLIKPVSFEDLIRLVNSIKEYWLVHNKTYREFE